MTTTWCTLGPYRRKGRPMRVDLASVLGVALIRLIETRTNGSSEEVFNGQG